MGLWVTLHAVVANTEAIKTVALVVIDTPYTLGHAVYVLDAERCFIGTACVVFDITGDTGVVDALAIVALALSVLITGHTLIAILTGNTDPKVAFTASIATDLAGLAGA